MSVQLARRPATEADLPFLLALRRDSMDAHLAASGAHLTDAAHRDRIRHRFDCAEVLLQNETPVGLLKLDRRSDVWEIIQIQLLAEVRGRGIGGALLRSLIEQSDRQRVPLELHVLHANPARKLYQRLGFTDIGKDAVEFHMRREAAAN